MKKTQIYFFLEELNSINIPILKKLKNISIIYRNYSKNNYVARAFKIKKFSQLYRHNLFVSNDLKLANRMGANLYIPSFNKQLRYLGNNCQKKIKVIGSAHNHSEINNKILQGCSGVFISPLYTTDSHTKKNALGFSRFNNLKQYFKSKLEVYALGGIGEKNLAKIHSLNVSGFALKSFLEKRQSQKSLGFLNLIARSNVIS
jgi:thiamine-phosphate pyrophosphorylase